MSSPIATTSSMNLPWTVETPCPGQCCWHLVDATGQRINFPELSEAHARHIMASVNACTGLPDGALAGGWTATGMSQYARQIESERSVLQASLGALLDHYVSLVNCGDAGNWNPEEEQIVIDTRAAIAGSGPATLQRLYAILNNNMANAVTVAPRRLMLSSAKHTAVEVGFAHLELSDDHPLTALLASAERVSRYLCGGHYEPRSDDEAAAAADLFTAIEAARHLLPAA